MEAELRAACAGRDIEIKLVDVDSSPEFAARYGLRVPVLAGSDGELGYGRLDLDAVEDYLAAYGV
jgi:hypothetical protein